MGAGRTHISTTASPIGGAVFHLRDRPLPKIATHEAAGLNEVLAYMRRHRLKPDDLTSYDARDFRDRDPLIRATAGAVSRTWGHMARLRVTIDDITAAWPARKAA
jgi:hypothetical protein